jgi:hypothetical protein
MVISLSFMVVGGFALLSVESKEEAIQLTKDFLEVAGDGERELRQVYEGSPGTSIDANV